LTIEDLRYELYSPQVIQETIEGEVIIVNLDSGNYYSLNRSGGDIWQLALGSYSQSEIIAALQMRYSSGGANPVDSVPAFLNQLIEQELLKTSQVETAPPPIEDLNSKWSGVFEEPKLEVYSDMQELLLLDPIHEVDEGGWPTRPE
jgi:hypothetical protein